jgi:catechol 2,3-dioxygenase-like lactoylglutathione lyase family enzyme
MPGFNFVLAYVADVPKSVALYSRLLGLHAVESSPNFAMFVLPNGIQLGLWAKHDVEPAANQPGGIELAFTVPDEAGVNATVSDWQGYGLSVLQPPTFMDFGFTATLADPDGHRLRVFAPGATATHSRAAMENTAA